MKLKTYSSLGILGILLSLYYSLIRLGLDTKGGALLFSAGLVAFTALLVQLNFKKAILLAGFLYLLAAAVSLVLLNSIFTGIIPAFLGVALILEGKGHA